MAININDKPFDEATKLKLDIFGECFEEWLPVFIHNSSFEKVVIFDFFAGSGSDIEGTKGSPLVLLDKARGKDRVYCLKAKKEIMFIYNEGKKRKSIELLKNVEKYIENCEETNNCENCIYNYQIINGEFKEVFKTKEIQEILVNPSISKFILLDQYGFSEIDADIFLKLINYPLTDFIFFISSSFINRFKEHPNVTKYIDTSKICFEDKMPNEVHRAIAKYFRDLIPADKEYYLHHFSIRKDPKKGNYYGLIFGSNFTYGMEKFLKVCWRHDKFSGEANYNIDNNYEKDTLFHNSDNPFKKELIRNELEEKIISEEIQDNISGFKYAMHKGCEPNIFTEVVKKMEKEEKIERFGELNYSSTRIHNVKQYFIRIRGKNGT